MVTAIDIGLGSVTLNNPGLRSYVVGNLAPGTDELVARSVNSAGLESVYSNPATRTVNWPLLPTTPATWHHCGLGSRVSNRVCTGTAVNC